MRKLFTDPMVTVTVTVPVDTLQKLDKIADISPKNNRSSVVRKAINKFLSEDKEMQRILATNNVLTVKRY